MTGEQARDGFLSYCKENNVSQIEVTKEVPGGRPQQNWTRVKGLSWLTEESTVHMTDNGSFEGGIMRTVLTDSIFSTQTTYTVKAVR